MAGIQILKKVRKSKKKSGMFYVSSFCLGLIFWLSHLYVVYTAPISFSSNHFTFYFLISFIFCTTGTTIGLAMDHVKIVNQGQYILGSIVIAICTLATDFLGFSFLFEDQLDLKISLSVLTVALILSASFPIFRFLIQITNESATIYNYRWVISGCVLTGLSFASMPYMVMVSILNLESLSSNPYDYLVPIIIGVSVNLPLALLPNLFGESMLIKNIHSYTSLFENNPVTVLSFDLNGVINSINKQAVLFLGYKKQKLIGMSIQDFLNENDQDKVASFLSGVFKGNVYKLETQIFTKSKKLRDVNVTAVRTIVDKRVLGFFAMIEDITEIKKSEKQIKYLAYHDEVTNLPNKRMAIKKMMNLAKENIPFSILLIDFDRFKRINDTFGHTFGDRLLVEIGNKFKEILGEKGTIARLGGDEFLVVIPLEHVNYRIVAESIIQHFRKPMLVDGYDISITASVGIANYPQHTKNVEDLVKYADIAMYEMKENGANGYMEYNKQMANITTDKLNLENELKKAIANFDLVVYFQPKMNTRLMTLAGAEALVRWKHPSKGMISPCEFIPLAEESGLIIELERYVIVEVCRCIKKWKIMGKKIERVSVNISLVSLYKDDIVLFISKTLEQYEVSGDLLELEITERIVMKNEAFVNNTLQNIRKLGLKISIDDFGTGYSSLSYLYKLHIDCLKIDKSFIDHIEENKEVVSAIISMAHNLKLDVIAEGVETELQVKELLQIGCEEVQGYFFSPPVPVEEFELMLNT